MIMRGFTANIENESIENRAFRRVLFTGENLQLVLMSLKPGEEIGSEIHADHDQFFRVEAGQAKADIAENSVDLADGSVFIVPAGVRHNITNSSPDQDLKLYTIYAPPNHPDGTVHETKAEADAAEAAHAE